MVVMQHLVWWVGGVRFVEPLTVSGRSISRLVSGRWQSGSNTHIFDWDVGPSYQTDFPHDLEYIRSLLRVLSQHPCYRNQLPRARNIK